VRKTFYTFILCCIISGNLFSSETDIDIHRPILSQYSKNDHPLSSYGEKPNLDPSKKYFSYLALGVVNIMGSFEHDIYGPLPSLGISRRYDSKAADITIRPYIYLNTLSISQSKIFYQSSLKTGLYTSVGIGGFIGNSYSLPLAGAIIPIRAGYEGKNGFIDLGVELGGIYIILPYAIPELRAGLKF
jgi:hypothetical protein